MRVGYLGPDGTVSHEALMSAPGAARFELAPQPTLHEVRQRLGANVSDEELILRFFAGNEYVDGLPDGGKPRPYLDADQPLVKLIEQLSKRDDPKQIFIQRPGLSIRMERRAG